MLSHLTVLSAVLVMVQAQWGSSVKFTSSGNPSGVYTKASSHTAAPTCHSVFTDTRGLITTPYYPDNYDNKMDCMYSIQPANLTSFWVTFYACDCVLENSSTCYWDFILFGVSGTRYCGYRSGESFRLYGYNGRADVFFHSDSSVTARGCQFAYAVTLPDEELSQSCPGSSNTNAPSSGNFTSGFNYTTPSGNFTSDFNYTTLSGNFTSDFNYTTLSGNFTSDFNYTTPSSGNFTSGFNYTTS